MGCAGSKAETESNVVSAPSAIEKGMPPLPQTQEVSSALEVDDVKPELPAVAPDAPEVALAKLQTISSSYYYSVDGLLASVESGAIAALKGRWLCELHEEGGQLQQRQDMPAEAFWTPAELRTVATALGENYGVLFVALSTKWLSSEHPDPDGFHLDIVAEVAKLYLGMAGEQQESPLVRAFSDLGIDPDFALFWSYPSLPQPPLSADESALCKTGVDASKVWFGHSKSVCWMQSELPAGFGGGAYDRSGWCIVEAAISALLKPGHHPRRLDLARRTEEAMAWCYGSDEWAAEACLDGVCTGQRLPLPKPERLQSELETEKVFAEQADLTVASELYRSYFAAVAGKLDHMDQSRLGWGEAEVELLSQVLPQFSQLKSIDLSSNTLGAAGIIQILQANGTPGGSLAECNVRNNNLDDESTTMLAKVGTERRIMLFGLKHGQTAASFQGERLGPLDAILLASDLGVSDSLTKLDLSLNMLCGVDEEGEGEHTTDGLVAISETLKVTV